MGLELDDDASGRGRSRFIHKASDERPDERGPQREAAAVHEATRGHALPLPGGYAALRGAWASSLAVAVLEQSGHARKNKSRQRVPAAVHSHPRLDRAPRPLCGRLGRWGVAVCPTPVRTSRTTQ